MGNDLGLQYIMDGNGNYYTVNGDDQLVVANSREEAGVFTFFEANQRIGGGKKAKFYLTIPAESIQEAEMPEELKAEDEFDTAMGMAPVSSKILNLADRIKESEQPNFKYCIDDTNWNEFANYYLFLATHVRGYQEELAKQHSDVEKEICDLLHYVELYDLTNEEGLRAMDMLKDARQRRRNIKDELSKTEFFQKMIGTSGNVAKVKGFLTEIKKLDTRKYYPRQLQDLFKGMDTRATDRDLYRERFSEREDCRENENAVSDMNVEKWREQEMSFTETIFDGKANDWLGFARQQMEFYQNAEQYMVNLQIGIDIIDRSIENVMEQMEEANYNVTQGYKVFKQLKDLRNERKTKERELAVLKIMTECFDLTAMADAFTYNMTEIEKMISE